MTSTELWSVASAPDLEVAVRGAVDPKDVVAVRREVGDVLHGYRVHEPARVRLSVHPEAGGSEVLAQINVRCRAAAVRVQVTGPGRFVAALAADRLERQLIRCTAGAMPRAWPDPARPPLAFVSERRPITRRKSCTLLTGDPWEAQRALDEMDYDAHLFTCAETGEDAVIYRAGPFGVRLARQHTVRPPVPAMPLTVHPHPALVLTGDEAAARLCRYGLPHLFFTDPADKRGRLLLRRYDGDLALIGPAEVTGIRLIDQEGEHLCDA
ncbi:sigma 54 modulation/S30EA ribosomal C-terminal domain-containing protein [Nocardia sp. NPDC006044]|uniref:sigma 54 modulation/S30EA ribosomal C-terminal domain-containing protein n=1 Tax=Nocardia sp. NPDC006044 TaxID=3364306 RepID=UPI003673F836